MSSTPHDLSIDGRQLVYYLKLSFPAVLSQEPVSGDTIVLDDEGSGAVAEQVIAVSRTTMSRKRPIVQLNERVRT